MMMWLLLIMGGLAGAGLSGTVTYGFMIAREKIIVDGATRAERSAGTARCNQRVGEIERSINQAVEIAAEDARAAASRVTETPTASAQLRALCDASVSCRSRSRP